MKTVPLADVLWTAANEKLRLGDWGGQFYSCDAVHHSLPNPPERVQAKKHLAAMGCPTECYQAFPDFWGDELQGVRYMWLLLAMHAAEDEGIMLEVSK